MNIRQLKTMLISAVVCIGTLSVANAQTVSVNGSNCNGATVTFGTGTIAINTAGCGGGTQVSPPSIVASTPPAGTLNTPYSFAFTATGATPYQWSISSGTQPTGLTINQATGVLSGTPTAIGTFAFSVTVSNTGGPSTALPVSIAIGPSVGPPQITSTAPTTATVGVQYSHQFTATGAANITYSISGAQPPAGITITSAGLLSGIPTAAAGTYTFVVTATNGTQPDATQTVSLVLSAAVAPTITSFAPPTGNVNQSYTYTFGASGTAPIAWDKASGTLPPGLQLSTAGVLSGTPTTAGTYTFVARATNSASATSTNPISVTIGTNSPVFGAFDINGNPIPTPVSRHAKVPLATHAGLNGGGSASLINAWSVDTSSCATTPALNTLWYHNIDLLEYGTQSASEFFDFIPNQSVTYGFKAPVPTAAQELAAGQVIRLSMTQASYGTPANTFISVSSKPCDFDTSKIASGTKCYATGYNENGVTFQITAGAGTGTLCKLIPNQQYYINVRFHDARPTPTGTPTQDACTNALATNPGSPTCGYLLAIQAY